MQSWADIASDSDDDADVGQYHPVNQEKEPGPEVKEEEEVVEEPPPKPKTKQPKSYNWPTNPPFTAFVGNLAYSVRDADEMSQGVNDLLHDRFQAQANIVTARLAMDRERDKPRGFGYIELETVEDLKTVMRLNDGQSMFKGRVLKLDVAEAVGGGSRRPLNRQRSADSSRGSFVEIDGSQFRGGRYARRDSSSSLQRQSSVSSETSETKQRPSLKLAPRSKPREEAPKEGSSSSLYGGGKARDETEWEQRRREASERRGSGGGREADRRGSGGGREADRRGSGGGREADRRGSGGGRGRGSSGRGGGRGGGSKQGSGRGSRGGGGGGRGGKGREDSKKAQPSTPAKKPDPNQARQPVPQDKPAEPAKAETSKVQNRFAAFNMDSDSE